MITTAIRCLAVFVAVALVPALPAAPAAAADGSITSPNIVLFDNCDYHRVTYNLALPDWVENWSGDLLVIGPDGKEAGDGYIYDDGYVDSGADDVFMCDDPRPGTYRLKARVEGCDYWYDTCSDFAIQGSTFNLRYPKSTTVLGVTGTSRLKFKATVKDERPRGMFPSEAYTTVILQQKKDGRWVRVARSYTNSRGIAHFTVRNRPGKQAFRAQAIFDDYDAIKNSVSRTIRR